MKNKILTGMISTLSTVAVIAAVGAYRDVQSFKPKIASAMETKLILCEIAILNEWKSELLTKACGRRK